ncbi:acyl-CoA binding domain-containing protein 6 [Desmophyllum pertusum]|uniref:Acyl-CoA binding domain-containing protein 6 n=1 Tax=Desmophyllum pertusum TaxID=174260 RepID=A0A9W9YFE0_9CNID|nr:acyl-CoA binding domain-containing protein 6 [Desmophyllum pertusum]
MGLAVSTLRGNDNDDDIISDANKSVFDWCKEGNVKKMDVLLTRRENLDAKDDQDADGQTPLHYGKYCTLVYVANN